MRLEDQLFLNHYRVDTTPHIKIKNRDVCLRCEHKQCTWVCPVGVYEWDEIERKIVVGWENCIEMGACMVACNQFDNIDMVYPRGGYGIRYRFG